MKKIILIFALIFSTGAFAQDMESWRKMSSEQRREAMKKMSPSQRSQLLKQYKQHMLVDELEVPQEKQDEFAKLYQEYEESQKKIKQGFKPRDNYNQMSDSEAKQELESSFRVGEELLRNRRVYSEKFQKVVKPQQVLEMFQQEGAMRSRMMDRRVDSSVRSSQPAPRGTFENGKMQSPSLRNKSAGSRGFRN